jgi:hypothetical protein
MRIGEEEGKERVEEGAVEGPDEGRRTRRWSVLGEDPG